MKKYVTPSVICPNAKNLVPLIAAAAEGVAAGITLALGTKALTKKDANIEYCPSLGEIPNMDASHINSLNCKPTEGY